MSTPALRHHLLDQNGTAAGGAAIIRLPQSIRVFRIGALLFLAFAAGLVAAYAMPTALAERNVAAPTLVSTSITITTTRPGVSGSHFGSTGLFIVLLLGLVLLLLIPYVVDVTATQRRQKELIEHARQDPQFLSRRELNQLVDRATSGSEGLVRAVITFGVMSIFAAALFYLLIKNPTLKHATIVSNAVSALVTLLTAIIAFYFGTRSAQTSAASAAEDRDRVKPEEPKPRPEEEEPEEGELEEPRPEEEPQGPKPEEGEQEEPRPEEEPQGPKPKGGEQEEPRPEEEPQGPKPEEGEHEEPKPDPEEPKPREHRPGDAVAEPRERPSNT